MKILYILILSILISACGSANKKVIDKMYYRFPQPIVLAADEVVLRVKRPSALGILGNRPMVVQNDAGGLTQMHHNFWLESPKILLQNYLEKTFNNPLTTDTKVNVLNVTILHLEKKDESAIVELSFEIKNVAGEIVFYKTYQAKKQLSQNNIPEFVKGISKLLNELVQKFMKDMP